MSDPLVLSPAPSAGARTQQHLHLARDRSAGQRHRVHRRRDGVCQPARPSPGPRARPYWPVHPASPATPREHLPASTPRLRPRTYVRRVPTAGSFQLPQLSRLSLDFVPSSLPSQLQTQAHLQSPLILSGVVPSDRDEHIRVDAPLCDELLVQLLARAPALQSLSVADIQLQSDHSSRQWTMQQIELTYWDGNSIGEAQLLQLPRSTAERVTIRALRGGSLALQATHAQGLNPALAQRLHEWQFDGFTITLEPSTTLSPHDHPTALHHALHTLTHLQTTSSHSGNNDTKQHNTDSTNTVGLRGWHWSPATAHALAAAGPAHLTFEVQMLEPLTDELLGVALAMGPRVRGVWAQTLALRSEQHAGMVGGWWAQLGLGVLDLASFVKLPRPQQDCPIQLSAECVIVTGAVHTVGLGMLTDCFTHVTWSHPHPTRILLPSHPHATHPTHLAQLAALHTITPDPHTGATPREVKLIHWPMKSHTIQALAGLPDWPDASLDLSACVWPVECENECVGLVQHVPTGYGEWVLPEWLTAECGTVKAICAGLNERRAGLGLPPVRLVRSCSGCGQSDWLAGPARGWCEAGCAECDGGETVAVGEHVTLEGF